MGNSRWNQWIWNRRQLSVFLLGLSSGFPLLLTGGTLQAWLKEDGLSLGAIGLFSLVGLPYTIKFLWAPLLDRYELSSWGRRRSWIVLAQGMLAASMLAMSFCQPKESLTLIAFLCLCITLFSSTQDIAIDAYRREILQESEIGLGSSLGIAGYRVGMLLTGAGALRLADQTDWTTVYRTAGLIQLTFILFTWFALKEPKILPPRSLKDAVIEPLRDFFSKPGALSVIIFILLYKVGDQMATHMTMPFYLSVGYSKTMIGDIVKSFGLFSTIAGGILGGIVLLRINLKKALWMFGILQAVSTACFVLLATTEPNSTLLGLHASQLPIPEGMEPTTWLLIFIIAFENLSAGLGGAAFTTLMSIVTNKKYTATQFALLTSLMGVPRVFLASPTGFLVQAIGWVQFFIFCALIAIPGIVLIFKSKLVPDSHEPKPEKA
ncbi:MAG: AmpG family muropeptide MFS transporter [Bdellovibrionales bacterium]|nr:AmpG family muropeptide MFS transporter [Bdellovibrionales bacterium]